MHGCLQTRRPTGLLPAPALPAEVLPLPWQQRPEILLGFVPQFPVGSGPGRGWVGVPYMRQHPRVSCLPSSARSPRYHLSISWHSPVASAFVASMRTSDFSRQSCNVLGFKSSLLQFAKLLSASARAGSFVTPTTIWETKN